MLQAQLKKKKVEFKFQNYSFLCRIVLGTVGHLWKVLTKLSKCCSNFPRLSHWSPFMSRPGELGRELSVRFLQAWGKPTQGHSYL